MVLCVSGISWSEEGIAEDGSTILPHPELEVTDGWYRLRARVDEALARAARKDIIRIGRKIAVVGARVCRPLLVLITNWSSQKLFSECKEPKEILDSYSSVELVLSGNSSHLAPWHAKLGFQLESPIATFNSLTADGGIVPSMDIVVLKVCLSILITNKISWHLRKVYPQGFVEFFETDDGKRLANSPHNDKEEGALHEAWKVLQFTSLPLTNS
jgi:breast cancer 2 susceptibility protein